MMPLKYLRDSLAYKLIFAVGLTVLATALLFAFFIISYEKNKAMETITAEASRLSTTILLGTHYAMMLNARDDINQIIQNIARQEEIKNIRIFNKAGEIHFSNTTNEVGRVTNIKDEACYVCHKTSPPLETLELDQRKRIIPSRDGYRLMGMISPIYNAPGCARSCHFHPADKKVLGALDLVVSLEQTDRQIAFYEKGLLFFALCLFLVCAAIIGLLVLRFVNQPIQKLIRGTRQISKGVYGRIDGIRNGEFRQLADAVNHMAEEIDLKQTVLNEQRKEYQQLFEMVPCLITVQNKNFELLQYNHEFAELFHPKKGDYCFHAYKRRSTPCEPCPMKETFKDGKSHHGEQKNINKDGELSYWALRTAPIKNRGGEITAVMEISVDITQIRLLEKEVKKSEEKYRAIFNNIPNPLFVLEKENLNIIDCNASVKTVYGFQKSDILHQKFDMFFDPALRADSMEKIKACRSINTVRQVGKDGKIIFADIHVSPSQYLDARVLLVSATDITKRLVAEQQLIQAGKMATLGEMATGIAHELNQPLSVIKSASNYLMRKIKASEAVPAAIMATMAEEMDGQVDRASKIINHMREFGRKSDVIREKTQVNTALTKAFDIFRQQLKLRQIDVIQHLDPDLPLVMADENRLEQVFINLLINARDAIEAKMEEKTEAKTGKKTDAKMEECAEKTLEPHEIKKQIFLTTRTENGQVIVEIEDTGTGIPAPVQEKIFEPFFTTKDAGKGTGLGLSISYGIVKDYGGDITVTRGRHGGGALFILTFPPVSGPRPEKTLKKNH